MDLKKAALKHGFLFCSVIALFFAFVLTAQAVPVSQAGSLPSTTENGYISVQNAAGAGNSIGFEGKLIGDYRINGNTAICSYSAGSGVAGYTGTTTKYILDNNTMRAKVMYYLTPLRGGSDTPSGRSNDLPSNLKGKTYLWLYQQLSSVADMDGNKKTYYDWLYNESGQRWFQTSKINTYADVVDAALYYQRGVSGSDAGSSSNQYVVIHCLMDYLQHGEFTAPSYYGVAEEAAVMLYKFIDKYEGSIPQLPDTARAFIVNPLPNTYAQTLISIEYYRGYFIIKKSSSNTSATNGNSNYSLNGAEYSWYKTKNAASAAAQAVANGNAVPKGNDYLGYSILNSSGESTSLIPNGSTSSVSLYPIGTYYLVETKAPTGYILNATVKELKITASNRTTSNRASVSLADTPELGSLTITKSSSNSSLTSGNALYSLSGAEYTVYKDSDLQNVYAIITTNNGSAALNNIPFGTFYVKESKASNGFDLDNTVHQVNISSTQTSVSVSSVEPVIYLAAPTLLSKKDAETSDSLPGAKFIVEYYDKEFDSQTYSSDYTPKKRWLFETDSDGYIKLDTAHLTSSYHDSRGNTVSFTNDSFYISEQDSSIAVLPQGTIRITEVEAPLGYDADGNRYQYKLDDTPTIRQVVINSDKTIEYKTVTLHNEIEGALSRSIQGEKTWIDNNNANRNRPSSITVKLIKIVNGVETTAATTTTNASKSWKYRFTNQPITEVINGVSYAVSYRVEETPVPGYTTSYNGFDIINTEKLTTLKVNKIWNDNNNQDGVRPQSVIVRLFANGTDTGTYASLSEDNKWSYTFKNLPITKNNSTVSYTVVEDPFEVSDGTYSSSVSPISGNAETGFKYSITNTHEPVKTSVVVKKKWNDTDNLDDLRPRSIQIRLKGYINDTVVYETDAVSISSHSNATDDANVWSYTFEGLDKYRNGQMIDYVASELTLINEYNIDEEGNPQTVTAPLTVQEDGSFACVLENTHILRKINIDVLKVWDDDENRDGLRPDSVVVYLATVDENNNKTRYKDSNGNEISGILQGSTGWKYQFTGLPIYDDNRNVIEYSVEEVVPSGYTVTYNGDAANGITVTNSHHEETSVTVNKVWVDHNNQDGVRPSSVTINLLANESKIDEIELSADNNWTYTFNNLPVNQNGRAIRYSVSENTIPVPAGFDGSGYTARYSGISGTALTGYSITVTNVHEPETRDIDVSKVWDDNGNHDGIRPSQLEVKLSVTSPSNTGIGIKYGYMSVDNNWSYIFEGLPKYSNGRLIQYAVDETEIDIPESSNGYSKRISGNMTDGFTITNSHEDERIKVIIRKLWDDNNDSARLRPDSAEFNITGYRGQITHVTLNASNAWYYECEYDKYYDGDVQTPFVKEIHLAEGYVAHKSVETDADGYLTTYEYTVTNTFELDPTVIPVKKVWDDYNNWANSRPRNGYIYVNLYRKPVDGSAVGELVTGTRLSEINDWQDCFYGYFPRYINGVEYEYFVTETFSSSLYTSSVEGNCVDGFTVTNTFIIPQTVDIPFKKVWLDDDDRDGVRPDTIDIVLTGYNEEWEEISKTYATVKASDDWEYTFQDLPSFYEDDDYSIIIYVVEEVDTAKGYHPKAIYDGYEYEDLWLVDEMDASTRDNDPSIWLGLVNEHTSETTSVTVNKLWDDDNDRDHARPDSVTVNLLADGVKIKEAELNEENGWSYTFADLYVNASGDPIAYSITENPIETGAGFNDYTLSQTAIEGNADDGWVYTLTNHYDPVMAQVSVIKRWQDNKNALDLRPEHLEIVLSADGIAIQTHLMSSAEADAASSTSSIDVWKYTFDNLPKYNDGVEIQYTVNEKLTGQDAILYRNSRSTVSTDSNGYKTCSFTNRNKTATVTLQKANERGYSISGSVFELFFIDGTPLKLSEIYQGKYSYSPNSSSYTNSVSLLSGSVEITNLPPNAVIIAKEVTAPDRYSAYANDIIIDVEQIIHDNGLTENSSGVYILPAVTVNNYKSIMPATGGISDLPFYILAGMLLIGAFFIIIIKRKDCQL